MVFLTCVFAFIQSFRNVFFFKSVINSQVSTSSFSFPSLLPGREDQTTIKYRLECFYNTKFLQLALFFSDFFSGGGVDVPLASSPKPSVPWVIFSIYLIYALAKVCCLFEAQLSINCKKSSPGTQRENNLPSEFLVGVNPAATIIMHIM